MGNVIATVAKIREDVRGPWRLRPHAQVISTRMGRMVISSATRSQIGLCLTPSRPAPALSGVRQERHGSLAALRTPYAYVDAN